MKLFVCIISLLLALASCVDHKEPNERKLSVLDIIDSTYQKHGCENTNKMHLTFDFRKYHYSFNNTQYPWIRTRSYKDDDSNFVEDSWIKSSVTRKASGNSIILKQNQKDGIKSTMNSVLYFALLPTSLKDKAVNPELLGKVHIKGELYYKIKVTFDQEGGGDDYQDIFMYWIHSKNFTMDYLAYSYEDNGGGLRFREAINPKVVGGFRFQNYNNYAPNDSIVAIVQLDSLFNHGLLDLVSEVNLTNIEMKSL